MNLFIDTSSNYIIFILFNNENTIKHIIETKQNQSEIFISELDRFLLSHDLSIDDITCFYFAQGPGSFTGIRVGLTFAKALKSTKKVEIRLINSLYLLFNNLNDSYSLIDARGNKSYIAHIFNNKVKYTKMLDNSSLDADINYCTYENSLTNIQENLHNIIENNLYTTKIESVYIKEAF